MFLMRRHFPVFVFIILIAACNRAGEHAQNDSTGKQVSNWGKPESNSPELPGKKTGTAQNTEGQRNITEPGIEAQFFTQATAMKNAHNSKDYTLFLRYAVVPGMSSNSAHRDKLIARLKTEDAYLETQSIHIDSLVVLPVRNLAEKSGTYYALLPKKMYLTVRGKKNMNEGFLLGYSNDGGRQCYFVDLDNISEESLYQLLPDLNGLITWPGPGKTYQLP